VSEVCQEEGTQKTTDTNLNLVRGTFMNSAQLNTKKIKAFPNPRQILLIAGQSVERLNEDDFELALPGSVEQPHQTIATVNRRTGASPIIIYRYDF